MKEHMHSNPAALKCLHCGIPIPRRMTMANPRDGQLHKGMVMVCSNCTGAMILGDNDWRPMTKEDFERLPPGTQRALVVMVRGLEAKVKAGAEWSPYERS